MIEELILNKLNSTNLADAFTKAFQNVPVHGVDRTEIQICWKLMCMFLGPFGNITKNYFNKKVLSLSFSFNENDQSNKFLCFSYLGNSRTRDSHSITNSSQKAVGGSIL